MALLITWRSNDVADAPSRHAECLRHSVHDDGALAHSVKRYRGNVLRAIVDNVFIDLVRDGENVPLLTEVGDDAEFLAAEDLSRWVVRRIDNDGLRLVVESGGEFLLIERPAGPPQLDVARRRTGDDGVGTVIFIKRLEDDDFVARIDDGKQNVDHGFRRAARYGDFTLGIDIDAKETLGLVHQRIAKVFCAPRDRILIDVGEDRVGGRFFQNFGRRKIGISLRKIDRVVLHGEPRHFANDGFGK